MDDDELPNARQAERNQQRKLAYLPPVWPIVLAIAAVVVIAVLLR